MSNSIKTLQVGTQKDRAANSIFDMDLSKIIGGLFVFFCMIPWVNFGFNEMDSQPWPLMFGLFFLFALGPCVRIERFILVLSWLALLGILVGMFLSQVRFDFLFFRGVLNYLGFFIIFASFLVYLRKFGFPKKIILTTNVLWLVAGLFELFYPGILNAIVLERTTSDRGITSLAPEPTSFALFLFFNSWLLLIVSNYSPDFKSKVIIVLNLLAIFGFAISAMGVLFILLSFQISFLYFFLRTAIQGRVFVWLSIFLVSGLISCFIFFQYFENVRLTKIIKKLIDVSFLEIFYTDASMNARLSHLVLSVHGFFNNWGFPGGFSSFGGKSKDIAQFYNDFFWYGIGGSRIMSWAGSFLYELGFFGLLILIFISIKLSDKTRRRRFEILLLFVLLLSAIPISFPLIPMLMAVMFLTKGSSSISSLEVTQHILPQSELENQPCCG